MNAPVIRPAFADKIPPQEDLHPYVRQLAKSIRPKFGMNAVAVAQAYDDYISYRKPHHAMNEAERAAYRLAAKERFNRRVWEIVE